MLSAWSPILSKSPIVKQSGYRMAVLVGKLAARKLDKKGTELILVIIELLFILNELVCSFLVEIFNQCNGLQKHIRRKTGHL